MDAATPDAPAIFASILVLGVLLASAWLWIRSIRKPGTAVPLDPGAPAWSIGWVNFGIFLCALVIGVFCFQALVGSLAGPQMERAGEGELTPWVAVLAVLSLQIPFLAVFYLTRRFYPAYFADRLNSRPLDPGAAFKFALSYFLKTLPLIWLTTLIWGQVLEMAQEAGWIDSFDPQELVTLFAAGGDRLAIICLVFLAVVMAPIAEELIFRGCLYRFLKSQTTLLPAQLLSGCLFALMHGNTLSFVPLILVGVFLARVYESSGSILTAIVYHAFFNAFSLTMLFLINRSSMVGSLGGFDFRLLVGS